MRANATRFTPESITAKQKFTFKTVDDPQWIKEKQVALYLSFNPLLCSARPVSFIPYLDYIVSVLHQNVRGFGKSILDAREISQGQSSRVKGNLEGGGDGFPNTSRVSVEHGHSLIINLSTGPVTVSYTHLTLPTNREV